MKRTAHTSQKDYDEWEAKDMKATKKADYLKRLKKRAKDSTSVYDQQRLLLIAQDIEDDQPLSPSDEYYLKWGI